MMKAGYRKAVLVGTAVVTTITGVMFALTFNRLFGPLDSFPRLYKETRCLDGSYTAAIYRRKTSWLCPIECIEVIVKVHDNQGQVVQSEQVTSLAVWSDMNLRRPEVHCNVDTITIGGSRAGYSYEVRRRK
jgi:hypothetical protein